MGYQKDRESFIAEFTKYFPNAGYSVALAFLRDASGAQRYNEITSSINVGEKELARLAAQDEKRRSRVTALAGKIGAQAVTFNGDPRGCPFSIITKEGREVRVPGRGLPARCFR